MTTPNQPWLLGLYCVNWSSEDEEYVGTCSAFPSLSWLDPDPDEALKGIRQLVADCVADLAATGKPIPALIAQHHYSEVVGTNSPQAAPIIAPPNRQRKRQPQAPRHPQTRQ